MVGHSHHTRSCFSILCLSCLKVLSISCLFMTVSWSKTTCRLTVLLFMYLNISIAAGAVVSSTDIVKKRGLGCTRAMDSNTSTEPTVLNAECGDQMVMLPPTYHKGKEMWGFMGGVGMGRYHLAQRITSLYMIQKNESAQCLLVKY